MYFLTSSRKRVVVRETWYLVLIDGCSALKTVLRYSHRNTCAKFFSHFSLPLYFSKNVKTSIFQNNVCWTCVIFILKLIQGKKTTFTCNHCTKKSLVQCQVPLKTHLIFLVVDFPSPHLWNTMRSIHTRHWEDKVLTSVQN